MKFFLFLCLFNFTVHAADPIYIGPNCVDLGVTRINSKVEFFKYLSQLKSAAVNKDKDSIIQLVQFPLRVNSQKNRRIIENKSELKKSFYSIFTLKILEIISSQDVDKVFCRDQGVMLGNGEVWIRKMGKRKFGVMTVNLKN